MAQHIRVHRTGWGAAFLAAATLCAATAHAQPPKLVTLDEVVHTTLDRSPDVLRAREDVAVRSGQERQAKGAFDTLFHVNGTYQHTENYITPEWYGEEYKRRTQLWEAHTALDLLQTEMQQSPTVMPTCPPGASLIQYTSAGQLPTPVCSPVTSDPYAGVFGPTSPTVNVSALLVPQSTVPTDPLSALNFIKNYASIDGLPIPEFVQSYVQQGEDALAYAANIVKEYNLLTETEFDRLGAYPSYEVNNTLSFTGDISKPLRSGGLVMLSAFVNGTQDSYHGKPLDPAFGGKEMPNQFQAHAEVAFFQPLMRGRGAVSAAAGERAAARNLQAGRYTLLHTASVSVLQSTTAYIDLVAAQQALALLEDSLATQRRLLDANMRLSAAGEIARADVTRMQARVADLATSVAQARETLVAAQGALATSAGYRIEDIGPSFRSGETFPETPAPVDIDGLARKGVAGRNDIMAAGKIRDGATILRDAAHVDARLRLDMELHVGFTNTYTSPWFRVFPEEFSRCTSNWQDTSAPCFEPGGTPLNYYNIPAGLGQALQQHWEPVASVKVTLELPFGNNRQLGRLNQAVATLRTAEIQAVDLERVANDNVAQQAAALLKAKAEWLRRSESVAQYLQSWADTEKRRAAGDISLIDTLLTEQDLTSERLALVQAQHDYATALAQLRYETGTLLVMRGDQPAADLTGLVTK
jgi:outer membrane protein TolC